MEETIEDKRRVIMQVAYILRSEGWFSKELELTKKEMRQVKRALLAKAKANSNC
ncbi:MAG: hypothetical protein ACREBH_03445 [Candidatus Micrarchaeaceae archaeon]